MLEKQYKSLARGYNALTKLYTEHLVPQSGGACLYRAAATTGSGLGGTRHSVCRGKYL